MQHSCDRAAFVEPMLDGRLGPTEESSVARHLQTCASCARLARDIGELRQLLQSSATPISPLEHQRARLTLLRQAAKPSAAKHKPVVVFVIALLVFPLVAWAAVSKLAPLLARETPTPTQPQHQRAPTSMAAPSPVAPARDDPPAPAPAPAPKPSSKPRVRHHEPSKQHAAVEAPTATSGASRAFAEAMSALSRGDFGVSASKLADFELAYPLDARVEEALYLEAIALQRAGRAAEARLCAQRYLSRFPQGAHHLHASRITRD